MTDFDDNRIAVPDTEWTRMSIRAGEIAQSIGGTFVQAIDVDKMREDFSKLSAIMKQLVDEIQSGFGQIVISPLLADHRRLVSRVRTQYRAKKGGKW
jgi:hypothetical protein